VVIVAVVVVRNMVMVKVRVTTGRVKALGSGWAGPDRALPDFRDNP